MEKEYSDRKRPQFIHPLKWVVFLRQHYKVGKKLTQEMISDSTFDIRPLEHDEMLKEFESMVDKTSDQMGRVETCYDTNRNNIIIRFIDAKLLEVRP